MSERVLISGKPTKRVFKDFKVIAVSRSPIYQIVVEKNLLRTSETLAF